MNASFDRPNRSFKKTINVSYLYATVLKLKKKLFQFIPTAGRKVSHRGGKFPAVGNVNTQNYKSIPTVGIPTVGNMTSMRYLTHIKLAKRHYCFIERVKLKGMVEMINNVSHTNVSSAGEFLRDCIKYLKKEFGDITTLKLARKLDIPNSTLGRIENSDVTTPDFLTAVKIIRARCKGEAVDEFIDKFYPEMKQTFHKVYSGNHDVPFVPIEVETNFENPSTYELMLLATSDLKLTKEIILENYGKRGLATTNDLIKKGVLLELNDKILLSKGPVNAGQETVHKLLQNLLTFNYDINAFGRKDNWLSLQYESVDKDVVMPEVVNILKNANQKIRELLRSPSSKGNDLVWIGLSSDTIGKLDPKLEEQTGVKQ